MGILSKLFRKKDDSPIEITVDVLPSMLKNKFELQEKELEQYNANKIAEIKHLHRKALLLLEDIQKKEIQEAKNARFNKAAVTAKTQVENQLNSLLKKLNPDGRCLTLSDARAYSGEGYALMITEINNFRKSIVYTSAFLKEEMSELGKILQEMINSFNEMNNKYKEAFVLFEFEKAQHAITKISEEKAKIKLLQKDIDENKKLGEEKTKLLETKISEIETFKKSPGMEKLSDIERERAVLMEKKQDLKFEVASLIGSVDRPLQRFKALSDSGRWLLRIEQKESLELVLTNPLIALKKDPKAEIFKSVLSEVKKAIEEGKVELKEKEREKRLGALEELLTFDFFENVFWKLNELQKEQDRLNKEIKDNPAQEELNKKTEDLKETKKEIIHIEERSVDLTHEISEITKHIEIEMAYLTGFAQKALERKVIIEA